MKNNYLFLPALLLVLISGWGASVLQAQQVSNCPASPYPVTVKQADGSTLTIVGKGSMSNPWTETPDGYSVVRKNGVYQYATKAGGRLVPTGVPARNVQQRSAADANFLRQLPRSLRPELPPFPRQAPFPATAARTAARLAGYASKGKARALLLLIKYPDLPNTHTRNEFDNLMNQPNYRGTGSFRDFYLASSFGQLDIATDVMGWYTAAKSYRHYGWENGAGPSTQLVREAVDAAERAGVDFSRYDNDGDGVVDGIIVAHAGPGAEEGSQLQYIWSHRFALWPYGKQVTYDGVLIDDYIMNPEKFNGQMTGIGVICHEFGHNLNLPDLYDTDGANGTSAGLGEWCLMASAGWLGQGHTPGNMCAWARDELDWLNPEVLTRAGGYSLAAASGSNQVYRINTQLPNEYFLLENRQKTGLDLGLKGSGLAIWHINTNRSGNGDENFKLIDLEEADGLNHLDHSTNRGDDGDLFPGSGNKTSFDEATTPNANTYTGALTNIRISNIAVDETGTALFAVSFTAPPVVITSLAPASAPVGAGVAIQGKQLTDVSAVRFNGVDATEVYKASATLLYAAVPDGATSGPISLVARDGSLVPAGDFEVAPAAAAWKARKSLIKPRSQHAAVAADGRIYSFAGINAYSQLRSLEIYDPKSDAWKPGAHLPQPNWGLSYALGTNGLIYVITGHAANQSTTAYSYQPKIDKWEKLSTSRAGAWINAAAAGSKGKIYVFGGDPLSWTPAHATRVYDTGTNTWATAADIPVAVHQHSAVTGADGRIYVIGGHRLPEQQPAGLVQIYDPATDTWSAGTPMPIPKAHFGAVLGADNLIYVIGGKAGPSDGQGPFFHTTEVYNPATDSWRAGPVLPAPLGELAAASLDGSLYAIGGTDHGFRKHTFRLMLPPVAPASLAAKAVGPNRIDLNWQDLAPNEKSLSLERATSPEGPFAVMATLKANKTSYADTGLVAGTTYYFRLKATNAAGSSLYSNLASATTRKAETFAPGKDGHQDGSPVVMNSLRLGPNPMRDLTLVRFQVNQNQQVLVDIFDEKGNRITTLFRGLAEDGRTYQIGWKAAGLPAGIYICRLITNQQTFFQRIVVSR